LSQKSEYGAKNRDALKVKGRKYRSENKAKLAEYEREYYAERPGKRAEKGRKYYADNHERVREYARKYYAEYRLKNLKKVRAADRLLSQRRRARKAHFPDTLTSEQWENCVAYFGGACAACGSGGDTTLDHWIPISNKDCPGTVAENTVCLCAACNTSKHDRGALEWATWKFGESKANEFMSKVQAYFDSLKA
jgi:5-methylcytosine-specific restriction endonuclease McrA